MELAQGRHGLAAGLLAGLAAGGDPGALEALAAVAGGNWRPAIDLLSRLTQDSATEMETKAG